MKQEVFSKRPDFPLIGGLLQEKGLVSEGDVAKALLAQESVVERLGSLLVRAGALSEDALLPVLSEQLGFPLLDFDKIIAVIADVREAVNLSSISVAWCRQQSVVFWLHEGGLGVVARDPLRSAMREVLARGFPGKKLHYFLSRSRDIDRVISELSAEEGAYSAEDSSHLRELAEEAPVIELVNGIFARAMDARASDIHVEPEEHGFAVRFRTDGVLHTVDQLSRDKLDATVSRLKLISDLDISERRLPQDGRFSVRAGGIESDVRISVMPGVWGESVVMRLLPKQNSLQFSLQTLGMLADHESQFIKWVKEPHGIVLVTGPTGSGKSTTLYTALGLANDRTNKIITVEDPVEYKLQGVTQIQIQSEIGYTFGNALRSILRHDPDVIMIGEMRDLETAQIAVQASLTGHMVFSTLHTNDALSAFGQLIDMGVEPYLVASSLRGVVAQRLVRRLCQSCKQPAPNFRPPFYCDHVKMLDWDLKFGASNWCEATGCPECNFTGFKGRLAIYEFLAVDAVLQKAIAEKKIGSDVLAAIGRESFRTLFVDGLVKAYQGLTTPDEVLRVAGMAE